MIQTFCDIDLTFCVMIARVSFSELNKSQTLSNFIAGRPKAALLFWFFGNFRRGVWLFMVTLVIFKYKIGKNSF